MKQDIAYLFLESTDSTQSYAKEHLASFFENDMTCIYTDFQTGGVGRKGDPWVSEKGASVLATFVFRWKGPDPKDLSLLGPLSVQSVLASLGISADLKWPNDVLVNGKKISGTLVDVVDGYALLGIGMNVKQQDMGMIDQKATSIALEGVYCDPKEVLLSLGSEIRMRRLALQ